MRYSPHYLVATCGMETTADAKETLRKFFAEHAETELTKGDVEPRGVITPGQGGQGGDSRI